MTTLTWIVGAAIAGGLLSVLTAAVFAFKVRASWVPMLVSFAIGALLGAAFLEVLPEAIIGSGDATMTTTTVLAGILGFFVLEKLVLWRHCHIESCEGHEPHGHGHDGSRSGLMILVGDTFHNFVDGVLIAAAFMEDPRLGLVMAVAIVAHEIPQEVGDFLILLHIRRPGPFSTTCSPVLPPSSAACWPGSRCRPPRAPSRISWRWPRRA